MAKLVSDAREPGDNRSAGGEFGRRPQETILVCGRSAQAIKEEEYVARWKPVLNKPWTFKRFIKLLWLWRCMLCVIGMAYCMKQLQLSGFFHDLPAGRTRWCSLRTAWIKCSAPERCCWRVSPKTARSAQSIPPMHGAVAAEAVMDTAVEEKALPRPPGRALHESISCVMRS
jgi:hypothetical protein